MMGNKSGQRAHGRYTETSPNSRERRRTQPRTTSRTIRQTNAYRVLSSDGSISFKFQWHDPADTRDPMEMLIGESIEFDDNDKASQAQRLGPPELEALLDNAPTEVQ